MIKFIKNNIFPLKNYDIRSFCFPLLLLVYGIGFIGVYLIYMLDIREKQLIKQVLYQKQIIAFGIGLALILVVSLIDYHFIAKISSGLYIIGIGLLLICKYLNNPPIYGWAHYTARRWIKIGGDPALKENNPGFEFQPSELGKVALVVFLAMFFFKMQKHIKKLWVLALALLLTAIPTYFIFEQPDLSTTILIVAVFSVMVLISGASYKYIVTFLVIFIPTSIFLFWYVQQDFQVLLNEYQQNRVLAMLHPEDYPALTYQQQNAEQAIKAGGLVGKFMNGLESDRASRSVPVKESDFIFSAVAEEFGFIGSIIVLVLYAFLILFIIRIARKASDYLGRMIAIGFGTMLLIQVFINVGVVTSLLPNTGIALPFMSSGLSSLLVNLLMIGIILNISMQPKKAEEPKEDSEFGFIDA